MIPVQTWSEKLNKVDGTIYVIEEEIKLVDGVYEAELQHDNINVATLAVYTGPKLTGERIQTYTLSTPSLTPWKRMIRVYASVPTVYISYETDGDTVEAIDINRVQESIEATQKAVNEEETRSLAVEQQLKTGIENETKRAKAAEKVLTDNLSAETTRAKGAESGLKSTIDTNKPKWDDKYTKNEVDNKFSLLETAIDWKESVSTFIDIAKTYPAPVDGWTVNTKDTDYTYRYNGTAWISISANAIPKATQSVDGLLTKEDKTSYDDANTKKHTHGNKAAIDKFTEALLTNWNDAYAKRHEHGNKGILDAITQILVDNWNDANSRKHDHSNKSAIDKITQAFLDNWSAAYTHVSNKSNPHGVTKPQIGLDKADNTADVDKPVSVAQAAALNTKVDKVTGKQLSTNDYTAAEKSKLAGIASGAKVNVQSDWAVTDVASDAFIKGKPTTMPASDVQAWAKAITKPAYGWAEIDSKPTTFTPASHTHAKAQITDMPTRLSQFTNDPGYITEADVDTSQNHVHVNKAVLDKITQTLIDSWSAAVTHISSKTNPHGVTASQVGAALTSHNHTKSQITDFPSSLPANGGNASTVGGFTVGINVPAGAKFTDTVYAHPNSGVTAGTYRSVTVNAQGHVAAGTNPTTLAGYGITDASAKSHNHDGDYLKPGVVTWGDLKGV